MVMALDRVAEVAALGLGSLRLDEVPRRRVVELARWGMAGKAPALRRHRILGSWPPWRPPSPISRLKATDDALELFDVLMTNERWPGPSRSPRRQTPPVLAALQGLPDLSGSPE